MCLNWKGLKEGTGRQDLSKEQKPIGLHEKGKLGILNERTKWMYYDFYIVL